MTGMKGGEWVGRKPAIAKQIAASWRFQLGPNLAVLVLNFLRSPSAARLSQGVRVKDPRHMETHGFASLPRGRFAFIGVQSSDSIKIIGV